MPRMLRFESPGSIVHIMARGIDGGLIFRDDDDRREFLNRFAHHRAVSGYKCLAWCLMPNHYHLLLRTNEKSMSRLMRPLNGGYARWFNAKYQRRGYVFQDRFKSVLCQDMRYASELVRYIHLNPIRAGLVPSLAKLGSWRWCGHATLLGVPGAIGHAFQDRTEVLRRFGRAPKEAAAAYVRFLADGIDTARPGLAGALPGPESFEVSGSLKGWPAVIGDAEFASAAMRRHEVALWRKHRQADYGRILERLACAVCADCGIDREELFRKGRSNARSEARAQFCRRAHVDELLPLGVIARFLRTTITPVSLLARRVENEWHRRH